MYLILTRSYRSHWAHTCRKKSNPRDRIDKNKGTTLTECISIGRKNYVTKENIVELKIDFERKFTDTQ